MCWEGLKECLHLDLVWAETVKCSQLHPESCQNDGRIRGGPYRAQARLTVSFQILLPVFGTSFRGDHRNTSTGICKWAGGRVVNLSRPFSQGCLWLDPALSPRALCLPLQVRVGAVQFSSVPRLEFPLDAFSTQKGVKGKIKRMVFK